MKMKLIKATIVLAAFASAAASAPVFADRGRGAHFRGHGVRHHDFARSHVHRHHFHRHRSHFGLFIGAPLVLAPWYAAPRYYPAPVVVPSPPPVYIEKEQSATPGDDTGYWYYCRESETYYPYVKECAGPWQKVVPQPPPA